LFGDYYFKSHADSLNRGGSNQYSGIPTNRNSFQIRRIYVGYDYNISNKFSSELLLAAEDNFTAFNPPSSSSMSGDETIGNKHTFYVKLANIRWKSIWKGTDLVIGEMSTPSLPLLTEKFWNYRSIEKTLLDLRKVPVYDAGVSLQGVFDPTTKNFGYNVMIGNGTGARPAATSFKNFYGDIYAFGLGKKLMVDLYADYNRTNWSSNPNLQRSKQTIKGAIAYNSAATVKTGINPGSGFTIGAEFFATTLHKDVFASKISGGVDTITNVATGVSLYAHGDIIKNKLRYFIRYDYYNPMNVVENSKYNKYVANASNYNDNSYVMTYNSNGTPISSTSIGDPTYKQNFLTFGLDYMPAKNVKVMPIISNK